MDEYIIEISETSSWDLKTPIFILGFPEIGLVGTIAAHHLIEKLKLKEIGYVDSTDFPPITVVHDSKPSSPVRIYGKKDEKIAVLISEIPISPELIPCLSKALAEWFKEKNTSLVISLGGVPHPKRLELKKLKVYDISCFRGKDKKDKTRMLKKSGVEAFQEGIIVGIHGIIMRECTKQKINSVYLMTESHYHYPDPKAAATAINVLNRFLNLKVDVKELLDKAEQIKIKARDLMERTHRQMEKMQKAQEQEIPVMYR